MNRNNNASRKKKTLVITMVLLGIVAISAGVTAVLWQKPDSRIAQVYNVTSTTPVNFDLVNITTATEAIAFRFASIIKLDEAYVNLLTVANNRAPLDSLYQHILLEEALFRNVIDSVGLNNPGQQEAEYSRFFNEMMATYRSILYNRLSMNRLRNVVNMENGNLNSAEIALLQNAANQQEKNNRIQSMELMLKAMSQKQAIAQPPTVVNLANDNSAVLNEKIIALQRGMEALSLSNTNLTKENDQLVKQVAAYAAVATNETVLNARVNTLQQKIEALNTELRLARVDCNISRVDAAQIISNSRQRKLLLSEASGILTSLSQSTDVTMKKKVQVKIVLLNKVAANTRD